MNFILEAILIIPLSAALVSWWVTPRIGKILSVLSGTSTFVLTLTLVDSKTPTALAGWLRADSLSVVFLIAVSFLYFTTSIFATGYVHKVGDRSVGAKYERRLFAGLNLFCWAMMAAPLVSSMALLWVAIEVTTVISALLVAIDNTEGATEASWKYVLIASMGLGIALFATILLYYVGSTVFGHNYDLFYPSLFGAAPRFPHQITELAFVLAVLGYGTKVGLVPVHTWLPDAHSEAPTPVSALLSGALLAISFYAILRYFQVTVLTLGPRFPRDILLAFGLASLLLAALYLAAQRDLKRLLAYSSIEHMGILAIGMSFAAPIAIVGVLLHVLAHAAAKGTAFFGAGSIVKKFGTKDMTRIRGVVRVLPFSGPMMVLAILALSAMPPFGVFRSEFLIIYGGLSSPSSAVVSVLVLLVTIAFFGLSYFATRTMLTPALQGMVSKETSWWIVTAMAMGVFALLILGLHPPSQLSDLLSRAASELVVRP